jgi:DNA-binding GntR family transcriptional regulator
MDGEPHAQDVRNAEQWVCQNVRRWILEGSLAADTEINQQELASRLGVSRSPVRDALRRLEAMGLVTINPNQRAVVTSFTLDGMREVFEMRAALEGLAAFHAASLLTASDLIELESLADVMARLPDVDAYLEKHELFHDRVTQRADMPRLRREVMRLREMSMPYIRLYGAGRDSAELIGESHSALVAALSGDPAAAGDAFAAHARAAYDQLAAAVLALREANGEAADPPAVEAIAAEPAPSRLRRGLRGGAGTGTSAARRTIEKLKARKIEARKAGAGKFRRPDEPR